MTWTDRQIAEAFVRMYAAAADIPYRVTNWPDDGAANQNSQSVDAVAEASGAPDLAIEVTKIESFPIQRRGDRQTEALAATITPELTPFFPNGVTVTAEVGAWRPGFDWSATTDDIKEYLRDLPSRLLPGASRHDISGVPFPIWVIFEPDLNLPFRVGRIGPSEEVKNDALRQRVEKALEHTATALGAHRLAGARTVLVLEHHDIALIAHQNVYTAFLRAGDRDAVHLDEVWFCRTDNPHRLDQWYGLHGPQGVLDRANLPNLRLGPAHDPYWKSVMDREAPGA